MAHLYLLRPAHDLKHCAAAAAMVFATSLDAYFQLTIMLMVLVIGITVLAHYKPFEEKLSQSMQVSLPVLTFLGTASSCHPVLRVPPPVLFVPVTTQASEQTAAAAADIGHLGYECMLLDSGSSLYSAFQVCRHRSYWSAHGVSPLHYLNACYDDCRCWGCSPSWPRQLAACTFWTQMALLPALA